MSTRAQTKTQQDNAVNASNDCKNDTAEAEEARPNAEKAKSDALTLSHDSEKDIAEYKLVIEQCKAKT